MPNLTSKVPVAQTLLVLTAMLFVVSARLRFWLSGFATHAGFTLAFLTLIYIGSASPPAELQRQAVRFYR